MKRGMAGFTLLEVIIAVAIFALISAMAYPTMIQALDLGEQVDIQAARLAELQKAMTIIGRDVEQVVDRPARDNYAAELAALSGGSGGSAVLDFTRNGWRNPAGWSRSHLQRVSYQLTENRLLRQNWWVLDRSVDSESAEVVLINNVSSVQVRFLDEDKEWQDFWPQDPANPQLPSAVELIVELEDWGEVNRIFRVVAGG